MNNLVCLRVKYIITSDVTWLWYGRVSYVQDFLLIERAVNIKAHTPGVITVVRLGPSKRIQTIYKSLFTSQTDVKQHYREKYQRHRIK